MALHPQRLALDQRRPAARPGLLDRPLRLAVDGEHVGAVDDDALEAVAGRAVGDALACVLEVRRGGVGPVVVVADEDDRQPAHAGEVHTLVRVPSGRRAVAEPGDRDAALASDLEGERGPDCDRKHRRQMADHGDEPEVLVGEMDVAILSAGRAVRLAHVVREDPPGLDASDDLDAEVAMEGRTEIVRTHRGRDADRGAFVAAARVEAARDLPLLVEDVASLLEASGQEEIAVDAKEILAREPGFPDLVERACGLGFPRDRHVLCPPGRFDNSTYA